MTYNTQSKKYYWSEAILFKTVEKTAKKQTKLKPWSASDCFLNELLGPKFTSTGTLIKMLYVVCLTFKACQASHNAMY